MDYLPFGGSTSIVNVTIEHQVVADATAKPRAALRAVSATYFDVLSIPATDGRAFVSSDEGPESSIAIVNEAFVASEPAGRERSSGAGSSAARRIRSMPWMTVVGVVGAVRGAGSGPRSAARGVRSLREGRLASRP